MATKYIRETAARRQLAERPRPFGPINPRMRLTFVIVASVAVVSAVSLNTSKTDRQRSFRGPMLRGSGEIASKEIRNDEAGHNTFWVELRIPLPEQRSAADWAQMDQEFWVNLSVGDRIGVLYKVGRQGAAVQIQEVGLVALEPPMR